MKEWSNESWWGHPLILCWFALTPQHQTTRLSCPSLDIIAKHVQIGMSLNNFIWWQQLISPNCFISCCCLHPPKKMMVGKVQLNTNSILEEKYMYRKKSWWSCDIIYRNEDPHEKSDDDGTAFFWFSSHSEGQTVRTLVLNWCRGILCTVHKTISGKLNAPDQY